MQKIEISLVKKEIERKIGCKCEVSTSIGNDYVIYLPADQVNVVVELLMDRFHDLHFSTITAQQREASMDVIEVIYHFWQGNAFSLMVKVPTKSPNIPTIVDIVPGADFSEREVAEMFGVSFLGREVTPHLFLPDDWDQGPPFIREEVHDE
jgi:NADH:ubiquinone oxidoreductase subunit C